MTHSGSVRPMLSKPLARVCATAVACGLSTASVAAPQGGSVVVGSGSIAVSGPSTAVNQTSDRLAIDWDSFNIANGESVTFNQPNAAAIALNRDFSGSASQIFGNLTGNGHIFLLNRAGILVGSTGVIDAAGVFLSDATVDLNDFASGSFSVSNGGQTALRNLGSITGGAGGVHLMAGSIENQGTLDTLNGDVTLASGSGALVAFGSSGQLAVSINAPLTTAPSTDALLTNTGTITAFNGNILLTSQRYSDVDVSPVSNTGSVNAFTVDPNTGIIRLVHSTEERPSTPVSSTIQDAALEQADESGKTRTASSDDGAGNSNSLNELVPDCIPNPEENRDCIRQDAIKRYLGRLLINGQMP